MPRHTQTQAARIDTRPDSPHPKTPPLKRIRRQADPLGAALGEHGGPVDLAPVYEQFRHRCHHGPGLGSALTQHRHRRVHFGLSERGQYRVRTDFEQPGRRLLAGCGQQGIVEAHRAADLAHPVVRRGPVLLVDRPPGEGAGRRKDRLPVRHACRDLGELLKHRLHQRRVEGVADAQPRHSPTPLPRSRHHSLDHVLVTGNHHRNRPVHRRDRHPLALGKPAEDVGDLGLGALDRRHRTTRRQPLHQPRTTRHQPRGVGEIEHTRCVGGGQLADRVAQHHVRAHSPGTQQVHNRSLNSEQRRLGIPRPVQQPRLFGAVVREQHLPHRDRELRGAVEIGVHVAADLVQGPGEHRELAVQLAAHAGPLAALAGEHPRRTPLGRHTGHHGGITIGQRGHARVQGGEVGA